LKSVSVEEHQFISSEGESSLFLKYYQRGEARIHIILVHGAVEHSGRHIDLVHYFLSLYQDIAITTYDHLGHGKSGGSRCYVPKFENYIKDFDKVCNFVQSKNSSMTRNFIFAHSLGGLITLNWILDESIEKKIRVSGLVFSSPCIKPKVIMKEISRPILEKFKNFAPKLHLPLIYNGSKLTRDRDRANDFDCDSLIPKFLSIGMASEIIKASEKIRGFSYYLKTPSLFLISGEDYIVEPESTRLFALAADKKLVKIVEYPDHYHELWNEIDRKEIFKTMNNWMNRALKD